MGEHSQLLDSVVPAPTAADNVAEQVLPRATAGELIPRVSSLRVRSDSLNTDVTELGREVYLLNLAERTVKQERQGVRTMLEALAGFGLSWTLMARMLGVSVPAIRKWRLGEGTSPENRHAVAGLAALVEMLDEQFMIEDPAAWLEIPLEGTARTVADIVAAGRLDLVFDYASSWIASPKQLLDRFAPEWRDEVATKEHETYLAPDGEMAIRRRSDR
jgi:hypothetical protein